MHALTQLSSRPVVLDRLFMRDCLDVNWCWQAVPPNHILSAQWGKSECQKFSHPGLKKPRAHCDTHMLTLFASEATAQRNTGISHCVLPLG